MLWWYEIKPYSNNSIIWINNTAKSIIFSFLLLRTIIPMLSLLASAEVVIMANPNSASDHNVGITISQFLQCKNNGTIKCIIIAMLYVWTDRTKGAPQHGDIADSIHHRAGHMKIEDSRDGYKVVWRGWKTRKNSHLSSYDLWLG